MKQKTKMEEEIDLYSDILVNDSMDGRAVSLEEVICKIYSLLVCYKLTIVFKTVCNFFLNYIN